MAGDTRYPVKFGRTRRKTLTTALALLVGLLAPCRIRPSTRCPGAPATFAKSVIEIVPEPGGLTPGVMSAMLASVPGAAFALTRSVRWKLVR